MALPIFCPIIVTVLPKNGKAMTDMAKACRHKAKAKAASHMAKVEFFGLKDRPRPGPRPRPNITGESYRFPPPQLHPQCTVPYLKL